MFALSFLNPLFLWGCLAVAIPVLIHLFHRQRYRHVRFSTVRFLRPAASRAARSLRLREWLLLALRMLLLLAFALALAGPVWKFTPAARLGGGGNTCAVLLLDNSYSLGRLRNNRPVFTQAQEAAQQALQTLKAGDQAVLFLVNDRVERPEQGALTARLEEVARAIKAAEVSFRGTNLSRALQEGYAQLAGVKTANREIYLFSDLQEVGWEALRRQAARFKPDPTVTVFLVNVGGPGAANSAVTEVKVAAGAPVLQRDLLLRATVRNFGPAVWEPAVLYLDGEKVQEREVMLPRNGVATVTFVHRFTLPGVHTGRVQIGPDDLPADDRYWFGLSLRPFLPVLLIDGSRERDLFLRPAFYLRVALNPWPTRPFAPSARIAPRTASPEVLARSHLEDYATIILADVPRLTKEAVAALERYVAQGGRVLIALGDQVQTDFYNTALFREGAGLLPAVLGQPVVSEGEELSLVEGEVEHPLFRAFEARFWARLATVQFYRTFTLLTKGRGPGGEGGKTRGSDISPGTGDETSVLMRFNDGRPALVERSYGRGKVLLFASTLHTAWNDFPLHGTYLPLLHQLVYYLSERDDALGYYQVGATISLPEEWQGAKIEQAAADGLPSPAEPFPPGVYRVTWERGSQRRRNFLVVNLDRRESDLTPISRRQLKRLLPQATLVYVADPRRLSALVAAARHGVNLQDGLLLTALLIALIEGVLANWLIRRR
ncbi:MAG TPA: VWA domain-containing protein [Armatimonadetes bacterium]|nr:VWA domain-containing protein [Armatimonadota bacterium]